jgi:hypothetical protein
MMAMTLCLRLTSMKCFLIFHYPFQNNVNWFTLQNILQTCPLTSQESNNWIRYMDSLSTLSLLVHNRTNLFESGVCVCVYVCVETVTRTHFCKFKQHCKSNTNLFIKSHLGCEELLPKILNNILTTQVPLIFNSFNRIY